MSGKYFIVYNPLNYNLMDLNEKTGCTDIFDVISYLSDKKKDKLNQNNFLDFLDFSSSKQRMSMIDTLAIELYSALYIQNQLASIKNDHRIYIADGKRRSIKEIIKKQNSNPKAVFITSMSSNFPAAAAVSVLLNHANIPVVIGGIHVSTSPDDVEIFIRKFCLKPEIVSHVKGSGDKKVLTKILKDIEQNRLKKEYTGYNLLENGVWGDSPNIDKIDPLKIGLLQKIPIIRHTPLKDFRINPAAPFTGCPFSCSFCSISTLPKSLRGIRFRDHDDFINELLNHQKNGVDIKNRYFFFTPDNLLHGKKRLKTLLKEIIKSPLKINYAVQISIDVADDKDLLKLLRKSGATHFFIGFESLNLNNLKHINKHIVSEIEKSKISVKKYYASKINKIHDNGISIHGSFIFGLPFDYFKSPLNNTGVDVARFCRKNRIGIQPSTITDLPGSRFFNESQENGNYIYGKKGTMEYFLSLCTADLAETNKVLPKSLMKSPLVTAVMAYEASKITGNIAAAGINSSISFFRSFLNPTKNGNTLKERFMDSLCSAISQTAVSLYKEQGDSLIKSNNGVRGIFQRLYENETDKNVKYLLKNYIKKQSF